MKMWKRLKCLFGFHEVKCVIRSACGNPAYDSLVCIHCWPRGRTKAGDDTKALQELMSRVRWSRHRLPKRCKVVMRDRDPPANPSYARWVP